MGGKDRTKELGSPYLQTGLWTSTMPLIWRMMKPLWETGNIVIPDSGFSMLREFVVMFERGVYGSVLVKKHVYPPKGIYRDGINYHCKKDR